MATRPVPSKRQLKDLRQAWLAFRKEVKAIRGQTALLRMVKTNDPMDAPAAWTEQLDGFLKSLEELRDAVEERARAIPAGAHRKVLQERDEILHNLEKYFQNSMADLFGGFEHVDARLKDPLRTPTEFSGTFLDYLNNVVDWIRLKVEQSRKKSGNKKGGKGGGGKNRR